MSILYIGQIEASTSPPPGAYPGHLTPLPSWGGGNLFISESLPGGGEFDLHALGVGNSNCTLDFMKSLAWRAIMEDGVLEDFRGKDCAFVANWLRGKGLNKLCAVFEGI